MEVCDVRVDSSRRERPGALRAKVKYARGDSEEYWTMRRAPGDERSQLETL